MYVELPISGLNLNPSHSTNTYTCRVTIMPKIHGGIMKAILLSQKFVIDIIFRVNYYFSS